jgi:hypothetical protein
MKLSGRRSPRAARIAAIIESAVSDLVSVRDLLDRFHRIIRRRKCADLKTWISDAKSSLLASFAIGIVNEGNVKKPSSFIPGQMCASSSHTRGMSPVPKSGLLGPVRGVSGNGRPYRD